MVYRIKNLSRTHREIFSEPWINPNLHSDCTFPLDKCTFPHQRETRLVIHQSEKCVITMQIWIDFTRFRKQKHNLSSRQRTSNIWWISSKNFWWIMNFIVKLLINYELRRKTFGDIGTECTERLCENFGDFFCLCENLGDFFFVLVDISRWIFRGKNLPTYRNVLLNGIIFIGHLRGSRLSA